MASQARRSPLCGQRGRCRLCGQLGRQRILLVDGRVRAARAVVVGGSTAAGCAAGITTLTLLTWIVLVLAAWAGRGDGAVLGPRGRGLLRADGEDGATGGTGKAALGAPEMRTYLAGQLVGQRGPGTHPAVELGRCPQYHLGGYTQLARQPVHIDHVCCSFSKRCRLNRYCMPKPAAVPGAVRSSRSLPQFTIARGGNPVPGWLLSGVGRKARPTVRGRTAGPHGHALRRAVVDRYRPPSTEPRRRPGVVQDSRTSTRV